ncbi:hypothetical protein CC117_02125 [Parafrankia colletiae]|uniref:Integral membrane protein n=1 Tax=Parafrankia colletiae TaxID=573497 RepID=A0A1S1RI99_9ACTN|nr:hypothetical protein [Parafrankia colletiae]MCK9901170.1 hypothetical protein [Frankia sp. Cpl3]OHV46443.1 hypothetical protein CC117_02125 [Parafrankia colletiae]
MSLSRAQTSGLVLCVLLGIADVVSLAGLGADDGPPAGVLLAGGILGLITLAGTVRRRTRGGLLTIVVSRVLSALLAIPVFFVDDAPDAAVPVSAVFLVLTAIALGLLAPALRHPQPVPAVS